LNATALAPKKFEPLIVTLAPTAPLAGLKPLIVGRRRERVPSDPPSAARRVVVAATLTLPLELCAAAGALRAATATPGPLTARTTRNPVNGASTSNLFIPEANLDPVGNRNLLD
jgi:hypothetical protein